VTTGQRFLKGHGTENDFVLLPDLDGRLALTPERVSRLCDRRAGLGGDGVLRVVPAALEPDAAAWADEAHWFMDYRNADGSAAEMCGNGIRVYARYLVRAGLAEPGHLRLATRDGIKESTSRPATPRSRSTWGSPSSASRSTSTARPRPPSTSATRTRCCPSRRSRGWVS
jgi:diaminopimelate epimerase